MESTWSRLEGSFGPEMAALPCPFDGGYKGGAEAPQRCKNRRRPGRSLEFSGPINSRLDD